MCKKRKDTLLLITIQFYIIHFEKIKRNLSSLIFKTSQDVDVSKMAD